MSTFWIAQDDTLPAFEATLYDSSGAYPIADTDVVTLVYALDGGTEITKTIESVPGTPGAVRYEWQDGDTAVTGRYRARVKVTKLDGAVISFPNRGHDTIEIG